MHKRLAALFLAILFVFSQPTGIDRVAANAAIVPSSDGKMSWEMPKDGTAFDIFGNVNGTSKGTTYGNGGYSAVLRASQSGLTHNFVNMTSGVSHSFTSVPELSLTITQNHRTWNSASAGSIPYIEVEYKIHNSGAVATTIDLAGHADVMIGSDDRAPLEKILGPGGRRDGLRMWEGNTSTNAGAFVFICGGSYFGNPALTPVDTLWIGQYGSRQANMWNDSAINTISANTMDTGMAYSWQNQTVSAGGDLILKVYFSVTSVSESLFRSVTFDTNGYPGPAPAVQNVLSGEYATAPADGTWNKPGTFNGWYTDRACTIPFNFSTPINADTVLYAGWTDTPPYYVSFYVVNGIGGTLTAKVGSNTSITSGDRVATDSDITFEAVPDPDYRIIRWIDNSTIVSGTGGIYKVDDLDRSHVVAVEFISSTQGGSTRNEIDYNNSDPQIIIESDIYGFKIDLTNERFYPPDDVPFEIKSYSLDGGSSWRNAKGSIESVFGAVKFPKLLNKGMILWLSNERINSSTKQPNNNYTDGTPHIVRFPKIHARPKAPRLSVNYEAYGCTDESAETPGTWALTEGKVMNATPVTSVVFSNEIHVVQIGVMAQYGKDVDNMGWGKFPLITGTQLTDGIAIKPFGGGKEQKYKYLIRSAPTAYSDGTYIPASKQTKITVMGQRKPIKYKIDNKKGFIKVSKGTCYTLTDLSGAVSAPLVAASGKIEILPDTTVSVWKAAVVKKPASQKVVVT